jgi:hypothetical protein
MDIVQRIQNKIKGKPSISYKHPTGVHKPNIAISVHLIGNTDMTLTLVTLHKQKDKTSRLEDIQEIPRYIREHEMISSHPAASCLSHYFIH